MRAEMQCEMLLVGRYRCANDIGGEVRGGVDFHKRSDEELIGGCQSFKQWRISVILPTTQQWPSVGPICYFRQVKSPHHLISSRVVLAEHELK